MAAGGLGALEEILKHMPKSMQSIAAWVLILRGAVQPIMHTLSSGAFVPERAAEFTNEVKRASLALTNLNTNFKETLRWFRDLQRVAPMSTREIAEMLDALEETGVVLTRNQKVFEDYLRFIGEVMPEAISRTAQKLSQFIGLFPEIDNRIRRQQILIKDINILYGLLGQSAGDTLLSLRRASELNLDPTIALVNRYTRSLRQWQGALEDLRRQVGIGQMPLATITMEQLGRIAQSTPMQYVAPLAGLAMPAFAMWGGGILAQNIIGDRFLTALRQLRGRVPREDWRMRFLRVALSRQMRQAARVGIGALGSLAGMATTTAAYSAGTISGTQAALGYAAGGIPLGISMMTAGLPLAATGIGLAIYATLCTIAAILAKIHRENQEFNRKMSMLPRITSEALSPTNFLISPPLNELMRVAMQSYVSALQDIWGEQGLQRRLITVSQNLRDMRARLGENFRSLGELLGSFEWRVTGRGGLGRAGKEETRYVQKMIEALVEYSRNPTGGNLDRILRVQQEAEQANVKVWEYLRGHLTPALFQGAVRKGEKIVDLYLVTDDIKKRVEEVTKNADMIRKLSEEQTKLQSQSNQRLNQLHQAIETLSQVFEKVSNVFEGIRNLGETLGDLPLIIKTTNYSLDMQRALVEGLRDLTRQILRQQDAITTETLDAMQRYVSTMQQYTQSILQYAKSVSEIITEKVLGLPAGSWAMPVEITPFELFGGGYVESIWSPVPYRMSRAERRLWREWMGWDYPQRRLGLRYTPLPWRLETEISQYKSLVDLFLNRYKEEWINFISAGQGAGAAATSSQQIQGVIMDTVNGLSQVATQSRDTAEAVGSFKEELWSLSLLLQQIIRRLQLNIATPMA